MVWPGENKSRAFIAACQLCNVGEGVNCYGDIFVAICSRSRFYIEVGTIVLTVLFSNGYFDILREV